MRRISSRTTFLAKRIFPVTWFGFLFLFAGFALFSGARAHSAGLLPFVIVPAIMIVFGYFIMKKLVFDLVDEVWDDGASLLVRNAGKEQRIQLSDITNVSYSPYVNPPRVTLSLRRPTVFGQRITFGAPVSFIPYSVSPVIEELIERVDDARSRRT